MRRFHGAFNWPEMRTYTRKLLHLKFNLQFIEHNTFLPSCFLYQKRALQSWNWLIVDVRAKNARRNSAASPPHREFLTQRFSGFSDARFLCCHLVEIENIITPHKITLFKHKSWTEKRIRRRQKCRYFEEIFFPFRGGTQINSKRGVVNN